MIKYYLVVIVMFSGCSHFTFNATMCNQIASDPQATIPKECRNYIEEEAQKAFDQTKHKQQSRDDIIEFSPKTE